MSIDGFFGFTNRAPSNVRRTPTSPTTTGATSRSSSTQHYAPSTLAAGDFAETTGLPSSGAWTDFTDIEHATPGLQKADYRSKGVVGVVKTNTNSRAHVVHSGVVFAWVTRGALEPPLSGIYQKTINGIFDSHVVIDVHPDDSFTMAATHDSDLLLLKQRLDALTKPPS